MSKDVIVTYPNDDDPRKEHPERPVESIVYDVEHYLMANTQDGRQMFLLDEIARDQGVDNFQELVGENQSLRNALEKFIDLNEMGAFKHYDNRADANLIAMMINEAKPKEE